MYTYLNLSIPAQKSLIWTYAKGAKRDANVRAAKSAEVPPGKKAVWGRGGIVSVIINSIYSTVLSI